MHIIANKKYQEEDIKEFDFICINSKKTLSIVMKDGTHYNFRGDELKTIIKFIQVIKNE